MNRFHAFLVLTLLGPASALACQFDTDCSVGSVCVKQRGQIYGYCAAGMNPGNDNDRKPVRDPLDVNRSAGNTCQFDTECGPGSRCLKERGQIEGVCVR
jgi:hypothetical protein